MKTVLHLWHIVRYKKIWKIEDEKTYKMAIWLFLSVFVFFALACLELFDVIKLAELIKTDAAGDTSVIELAIAVITMGATLYMCTQIKLMRDINHTEMSHEIYEDNIGYRNDAECAIELLSDFDEFVKKQGFNLTKDEFKKKYNDENYKVMRKFAYHYEYLGYMIERECVDFPLLFNTLTFPDALITKSQNVRYIGRSVYLDDLWNGTEYLYYTYEVKRKYNKWKKYCKLSRTMFFTKRCCDENCEKFKECNNSTVGKLKCLIKKRIEAKQELVDAEKNWIKFYKYHN